MIRISTITVIFRLKDIGVPQSPSPYDNRCYRLSYSTGKFLVERVRFQTEQRLLSAVLLSYKRDRGLA